MLTVPFSNAIRYLKLRQSRGHVGKVAVFGIRDHATGKLSARVVDDVSAPTLTGAVADVAEPGASVFIDEWPGYRPLGRPGFEDRTVKHYASQ